MRYCDSKEEVMGQELVEKYITAEFQESVRSVLHDALDGKQTDNYGACDATTEGLRSPAGPWLSVGTPRLRRVPAVHEDGRARGGAAERDDAA